MTRTPQLAGLGALFPSGVVVATTRAPIGPELLLPAEADLIQGASAARQASFAGGRHCARQALRGLGITDFPLLSGEHREPLWPSGVTGSISHCGAYCAAVVSDDPAIAGLGLDIERIGPITELPLELICTAGESAWLDTRPRNDRTRLAWVLFSAKESLYKAIHAQHKAFIEFREVELSIRPAADSFFVQSLAAELVETLGRFRQDGRYLIEGSYVGTGVTLFHRGR